MRSMITSSRTPAACRFAGLFGADGSKTVSNLEHLPRGLAVDDMAQGARIMKITQAGRSDQTIRAIARRMAVWRRAGDRPAGR